MTLNEKILLAAVALDREKSFFTQADLAVACWKSEPGVFGLQGYPEHPDTNKVSAALCGDRGIVKGKGWLFRVQDRTLAVSQRGRQQAERLNGHAEPEAPQKKQPLSAAMDRELTRLLASDAMGLYQAEESQAIVAKDAFAFWGIEEREPVDERIEAVNDLLTKLREKLRKGPILLPSGREVGFADLAALEGLHAYLLERFQRHLNIIRNRRDGEKEARL